MSSISTPRPGAPTPQEGPGDSALVASDFFARNREPSTEIIEGIARATQIAAVGGPYGAGKSPWLQELLVCRIHGLPWCGRAVAQGPAALLDFENPAWVIQQNIENVCGRYGVRLPRNPDELEIFTENDDPAINPATSRILRALESREVENKFQILEEIL